MRADRASDLHLVRGLTERQADQQLADDLTAERLQRANSQPGHGGRPMTLRECMEAEEA